MGDLFRQLKKGGACPNCGCAERYKRRLTSGGGHSPYLLQGLGAFMHYADVVVYADCGLTQFFPEPEARKNVRSNEVWRRI